MPIVLFCSLVTFKVTNQLVRNIFRLLQLYMVCDFQDICLFVFDSVRDIWHFYIPMFDR